MKNSHTRDGSQRLEAQISTISTTTPLSLYIKLHEKYYYSKTWHLSNNKFAMRIFLMRMLRHKSDISISKIKSEIAVLEKRIKRMG